jgi:uncharacterized RDD family membrane protein YckC
VFCSKCGANLAADTAFCQSCGSPVARTALATAPAVAVSPHAGVGAIVYATNVTYAGFWLRFVAHLIDGVIVSLLMLILVVPLFFLMGGVAFFSSFPHESGERLDPGQMGALFSLISLLVGVSVLGQWLYFAYLESGEKQATWGKQTLSLYVTDLAGNRVTFARASGRFFAKLISALIPLWIGYIMAGFTERKQALHDMIASCLVLRR